MERQQPNRCVCPGDQEIDAGMVESAHPGPRPRTPGNAVIERARAKHRHDRRGEDPGGRRCAWAVSVGDEENAGCEREKECDLVQYAAKKGLLQRLSQRVRQRLHSSAQTVVP